MPIKWDDSNKLVLLLKIIEANPITKCDTENIAKTWPGPEKPTPRAIYEQIKMLRKQAETNGQISPAKAGSNKVGKSSQSAPSTPATPKIGKISRPSTVSRSVGRKRAKKTFDDEEEEDEMSHGVTSSDETLAPTPSKRRRSSRSVSTVKTYYQGDAGSSGEDAAAREVDSEKDGEFDFKQDSEDVKYMPIGGSSLSAAINIDDDDDDGDEMED